MDRVRLCATGEERAAGTFGAEKTRGEGSGAPGEGWAEAAAVAATAAAAAFAASSWSTNAARSP